MQKRGLYGFYGLDICYTRDFGDEKAVQVWSESLQKTSDVEEKFILYKLLIELYEERTWFRTKDKDFIPYKFLVLL